ncbi:MAG TPA: hypothetical protein VF662_09540 [Allosphingosinicella sp.]|jgi:hypothetical protein
MRETLHSAVGSFGLERAGQQVEKAYRELERCRAASTEQDLRDAGINCAISIWHINDWLWAAIAQGKSEKPAVARLLGVTHRKLEQDDLVKWAVSRCPELNLVQAVCNASKHVGIVGATGTRTDGPGSGSHGPRLVIMDEQGEHDALKVFGRAIDFWIDQATNCYVIH